MAQIDANPTQTPWLMLRLSTGLSQREVERRLGWQKRGHLSLIERGVIPTPTQAQQLRGFYAAFLTTHPETTGIPRSDLYPTEYEEVVVTRRPKRAAL